MRLHRVWSACAVLLLAASVTSCAEGQFGQVVQAVGKNMAKGMCAEGGGPVSTAPEFCLYVEDIQVGDGDTKLDVVLKAVNRTGRPLHLGLARTSLSASDGSTWSFVGTSGIAYNNGSTPLSLEPGGEGLFTIKYVYGKWSGPNTTISLNGEIGIIKIDARGQPAGWFGAGGGGIAASRGFNFSRVGLQQQQPAQPLQQKSLNSPAPPAGQGASASATSSAVQGGTRSAAPLESTTLSKAAVPTAGARAWEGLDISGYTLGLLAEEISQKLKQNAMPLLLEEYQAELSEVPNSKFFSHVIGKSRSRDPYMGELELIAASFAPTPNKPFVGQISRIRRYPSGQQTTLQNTKEAILEKYGAPSFKWVGQGGVLVEEWTWVFDRNGYQIAPPALERGCHQAIQADMQFRNLNSLFIQVNQAVDECGRMLSIRMYMDKANLVWQLDSFMMDNYLVQEALARTTSMVSEYKKKQLEKQIQSAEKQGKPKL